MKPGTLSKIAGISYIIIFFAAIFANFFVLEELGKAPLLTVQKSETIVRLGILAFMITVVFDIVVAWALNELYKSHHLSSLSMYFRLVHAIIMGVAIFVLPATLKASSDQEVLEQVEIFKTIWLIGLFFFGIHLLLLGRIIGKPSILAILLAIAGIMYMVDTAANFLLPNYEDFASIFLLLVAVPSILGEMSFAIWLLVRGRKIGAIQN
jgi:hypothetical protein